MKKCVFAALVVMALSLIVLPFAGGKVNSGKENIVITEEVISGDPSAAAGITLQMASHWDKHLFWNTEYTIGSGEEAKSHFTFSSEEVRWGRKESKNAYVYVIAGAGFGSAATYASTAVDPEYFPFPEIVRAVAERTQPGETHTEIVRIGDCTMFYAVDLGIEGSSVEYGGDYGENVKFLTEFFHISTAEDQMQLTIGKDFEGTLVSLNSQRVSDGEGFQITGASAFGQAGCYYACNCEMTDSGKAADRGQNSGIFYLPFRQEDDWLEVEVMQMRKVCDLPEKTIPEGMVLDEEEDWLYLVVRGEEEYRLCIYSLEGEYPVPVQEVAIRQNGISAEEASSRLMQDRNGGVSLIPVLRQVKKESGGLLVTWSDNGFAFVTEEKGQYRLWCSGMFPDNLEQEEKYVREKPFPGEHGCIFDGERLVLAAYEAWESVNAVVAVYHEEEEIYCGLYRHSSKTEDRLGEFYQGRILPQGQDNWRLMIDRYQGELYLEGTDAVIKPLDLKK